MALQTLAGPLAQIVADCQARVKPPLMYAADKGRVCHIGADGQPIAYLSLEHAISRHATWIERVRVLQAEGRPVAAQHAQAIADEIADAVEAARNFQLRGAT